MTVLAGHELTIGYRGRPVVDGLTIDIEAGTLTALVGPNGSGKSTLLMTLARVLRPFDGQVHLDGTPFSQLTSRAVAHRLAVLPQSAAIPAGLRVRELVEQGRYPRTGPLSMLRRRDDDAMRGALAATGMSALADRRVDALSGGERQRAWIAMALAQETDILLLDEPTTYLDVRHQIDLMRLVSDLVHRDGRTVVMVLHDLNQAARYCDRIVAMKDGSVHADGRPDEVMTADMLARVFDVDAHIGLDPVSSRPMFTAR